MGLLVTALMKETCFKKNYDTELKKILGFYNNERSHDFDEDILKTQLQIFSKNFPLKEQLSIIDIENYFKELEPSSRKLLGKGKTRPQAPSHALRRPHTPSALPDPKPHALSWL